MTRKWAVLIATGLLCAGCSAGNDLVFTMPSPTPGTQHTTTTTTPATAANGTDLGSCSAGNCEVQVGPSATINLAPALQVGPVLVQSIQADTVSVTVQSTASTVTDSCTGDRGCSTNLDMVGGNPALAQATGHVGMVFTVNQLDITVVAINSGSAVLRLSTR